MIGNVIYQECEYVIMTWEVDKPYEDLVLWRERRRNNKEINYIGRWAEVFLRKMGSPVSSKDVPQKSKA